jgi:Amt family ammonium transporter
MFYLIDKTIGLRVSPEVEVAGIDLAYHGIGSYPEFIPVEQPTVKPGRQAIPSPTD